MGLLLLLAAAFSWHITRPLTRLAKAADQLAAGQPQRVTPSGPSETRILGERFNAMMDTLAESNAVQRTLLAGLPHDLKGPLSRMWLRIEMVDDPTFKDGMQIGRANVLTSVTNAHLVCRLLLEKKKLTYIFTCLPSF